MALLRASRLGPLIRGYKAGGHRTFTNTTSALGFGSHKADNDPEKLEAEKEKTLKGTHVSSMKSHPGWNEEIASDSEVAVKADKDDHHAEDHDEHLEKLQEHSVKHIKEVHHKGEA